MYDVPAGTLYDCARVRRDNVVRRMAGRPVKVMVWERAFKYHLDHLFRAFVACVKGVDRSYFPTDQDYTLFCEALYSASSQDARVLNLIF